MPRSYTLLPFLPSTASAETLAEMALGFARDHEKDKVASAMLIQALLTQWKRIAPLSAGTSVEGLAREVSTEVELIQAICPESRAYVRVVDLVWSSLALPHYTRTVSTLVAITNKAQQIAELVVAEHPCPPGINDLTPERYLHLHASLLGTYSALWIVIDQLTTREGNDGPTTKLVLDAVFITNELLTSLSVLASLSPSSTHPQ